MTTVILLAAIGAVVFALIMSDIYKRVGRNNKKTEKLFTQINHLLEASHTLIEIDAKLDRITALNQKADELKQEVAAEPPVVEEPAVKESPAEKYSRLAMEKMKDELTEDSEKVIPGSEDIKEELPGPITFETLRGSDFLNSPKLERILILGDDDFPTTITLPSSIITAIYNENGGVKSPKVTPLWTRDMIREYLEKYNIRWSLPKVETDPEILAEVRTKIELDIQKAQGTKKGLDDLAPDLSAPLQLMVVRYMDDGKVYEKKLRSKELLVTYFNRFPNAGFETPTAEQFIKWYTEESDNLVKLDELYETSI